MKVVLSMYEVEIKRMDHEGRGIGYINNKVTFIPNALPEEIVICEITETKKNYQIAKVVEYKKKSFLRVEPICPYYQKCGGCSLQHLSYEETVKYKKEKVENILNKEKIKHPKIEVVPNPNPKNYRNKLSLKIKKSHIGFFEENTHELIEINTCPLAKECINHCLEKIKELQIKNGTVTIRANYNDEILLIIETKDNIKWNEIIFKDLKLVGVVLNNKTIYGKNFFYERMNGYLFKVSHDAFFQINSYITNKMFSLIEENIENVSNLLDLYAGVGTLGLIASNKAKKVYSIEIIKNAVLDNLENKKLNKKENIFPMLGDAEKILPKIEENLDAIIIDPPRKGLDKNSRNLLLNSKAKKIIYISCDAMTLARDLKELTTKYEIEKFYILDMFSYTYHVESFCMLKKKQK